MTALIARYLLKHRQSSLNDVLDFLKKGPYLIIENIQNMAGFLIQQIII